MLEYQFTELDNDYITLWSRNFYSDYHCNFEQELETLAEMGQINAIQKWYQLHFVGDNQVIDKIAQSLDNAEDFNEVYAKGLYLFKTPEIQKQYYSLRSGIGYCLYAAKGNKDRGVASEYSADALKLSAEIMGLAPVKLYDRAYNIALDWGKAGKNGVMFERANEILDTIATYHPLPKQQMKLQSQTLGFNKKIRRVLWDEYAALVKQNPEHTFADSPVLSFYLAKSYQCFRDNPVSEKKYRQIASIFEELAQRPYSEEFAQRLSEKRAEAGDN